MTTQVKVYSSLLKKLLGVKLDSPSGGNPPISGCLDFGITAESPFLQLKKNNLPGLAATCRISCSLGYETSSWWGLASSTGPQVPTVPAVCQPFTIVCNQFFQVVITCDGKGQILGFSSECFRCCLVSFNHCVWTPSLCHSENFQFFSSALLFPSFCKISQCNPKSSEKSQLDMLPKTPRYAFSGRPLSSSSISRVGIPCSSL